MNLIEHSDEIKARYALRYTKGLKLRKVYVNVVNWWKTCSFERVWKSKENFEIKKMTFSWGGGLKTVH